jgi:hypothetical protein
MLMRGILGALGMADREEHGRKTSTPRDTVE